MKWLELALTYEAPACECGREPDMAHNDGCTWVEWVKLTANQTHRERRILVLVLQLWAALDEIAPLTQAVPISKQRQALQAAEDFGKEQ